MLSSLLGPVESVSYPRSTLPLSVSRMVLLSSNSVLPSIDDVGPPGRPDIFKTKNRYSDSGVDNMML